jgi:1,4-alpha-glucan branching enzyme
MLYLDYSRKPGEWLPNVHGGRENLEAIALLRKLNTEIYRAHPDTQTMAEESTAWPMVSRPTYVGGLGFGMKWDMGWMHDTLEYMQREPVHRKFHHNLLTFRPMYAFSENFVLPLSHDEVVYGKGSLIRKMPGDDWQRFANLRAYYGFMFGNPGKKLMFMGCEFGQEREWNHDHSLDWHLLEQKKYAGIQTLVRDLNKLYRALPALHQLDCDQSGFEWVVTDDAGGNVFAWIRKGNDARARCLMVVNFSPNVYYNYRVRVPFSGKWREVLNSDSTLYGGSNVGNAGEVQTLDGPVPELSLTVPPLAAIFLVPES